MHVFGVRHRASRVADAFVVAFFGGWRVKSKLAVGLKIQVAGGGIARWPGVVALPFVSAGGKNERFRQVRFPFVFEVIIEKRQLYVLAVVDRHAAAKINIPKALTGFARPAAVYPGAHHDAVVGAWVLFFDGLVSGPRAKAVFRVEQTADGQYGRFHVLQVCTDVSGFPELVEVGVRHQVIPEADAFHVFVGEVFQRAHF